MGVSEILEVVGGDRKSLTRQLQRLRTNGLVEYVQVGAAAPGHPAGLWSLSPEGERAVHPSPQLSPGEERRSIQEDRTVGPDNDSSDSGEDHGANQPAPPLHSGQVWVDVALGSASRRDFRSALASGELAAAASWIAQLDGDGARYLFSFEPEVGNQPIENLLAALEELGAICASGTVRAISDPGSFKDSLRTAEGAQRRASEVTAKVDESASD
jgi:hypothetical protein